MSANNNFCPCRTPWQRKWLALDVHHPKIQTTADDVEAFCRDFMKNSRDQPLFVLAGSNSSGKSHAARAIQRWCQHLGLAAFGQTWGKTPGDVYVRWPEAVDEFNKGNDAAMDDYRKADLLILDDIAAVDDRFKTRTHVAKLCQVLTHREDYRMFTVLTTDIQPESWREVFDQRVAERLFSHARLVNLFGVPSYRVR